MPITYTVAMPEPKPHKPVDPTDLAGEDISLEGGDTSVSASGDWVTVTGVAAGRQSVLREAVAMPGSLVRRPDWGMGMRDAVARPLTSSLRDDLLARARRRLRANPRVTRVRQLEIAALDRNDGKTGLTFDLRVDVGGRDARITTVIRAKGGG